MEQCLNLLEQHVQLLLFIVAVMVVIVLMPEENFAILWEGSILENVQSDHVWCCCCGWEHGVFYVVQLFLM